MMDLKRHGFVTETMRRTLKYLLSATPRDQGSSLHLGPAPDGLVDDIHEAVRILETAEDDAARRGGERA